MTLKSKLLQTRGTYRQSYASDPWSKTICRRHPRVTLKSKLLQTRGTYRQSYASDPWSKTICRRHPRVTLKSKLLQTRVTYRQSYATRLSELSGPRQSQRSFNRSFNNKSIMKRGGPGSRESCSVETTRRTLVGLSENWLSFPTQPRTYEIPLKQRNPNPPKLKHF